MTTANNEKTIKGKGKPRGNGWKEGQSGNPKGRPSEGQSWSGIIRSVTDKTAEELAAQVGGSESELGQHILKFPKGVPLKILIIARVVAALMFEPNSALLRLLVEAEELAELEKRIAALEQITQGK